MSSIYLAIVLSGLLGATVFLFGFAKGVIEAVRERRSETPDSEASEEGHYGISALVAVVASAIIIGMVGVSPAWIYAGPLLAIVTAIGVGICFLVGDR
jgi:hypothetical protein